ncbi:MAG: hypothetical protein OXF11_09820 [Deltaproteobacteria bacterium]|nr:hypothetical protein [Deltaproteobacteria bacterium]
MESTFQLDFIAWCHLVSMWADVVNRLNSKATTRSGTPVVALPAIARSETVAAAVQTLLVDGPAASISDLARRVVTTSGSEDSGSFHAVRLHITRACTCLGRDGYRLIEFGSRGHTSPYQIRASDEFKDIVVEILVPKIEKVYQSLVPGGDRLQADAALSFWGAGLRVWNRVAGQPKFRATQNEKQWLCRKTLASPFAAAVVQLLGQYRLIEEATKERITANPTELAAELCATGVTPTRQHEDSPEGDDSATTMASEYAARRRAVATEYAACRRAAQKAGKETPAFKWMTTMVRRVVRHLGPDGYGLIECTRQSRPRQPVAARASDALLECLEDVLRREFTQAINAKEGPR